jgi:hypothetical protein
MPCGANWSHRLAHRCACRVVEYGPNDGPTITPATTTLIRPAPLVTMRAAPALDGERAEHVDLEEFPPGRAAHRPSVLAGACAADEHVDVPLGDQLTSLE